MDSFNTKGIRFMLSRNSHLIILRKENRKLKKLVYRDSLTNLLNRRWLEENIKKIHFKYVYFIDINNLHQINRKYGYSQGDFCILKTSAEISKDRKNICVRWGGDEFIVFSNASDLFKSCPLYSVGVSEFKNGESIFTAGDGMSKTKEIFLVDKI